MVISSTTSIVSAESKRSQIGGWGKSSNSAQSEVRDQLQGQGKPSSVGEMVSSAPEESNEPKFNASRERLRKNDEHHAKLRALKKRHSDERGVARKEAKKLKEEYRVFCGLGSRNSGKRKCSDLRKATLKHEREIIKQMNRRQAKERKSLRSRSLR